MFSSEAAASDDGSCRQTLIRALVDFMESTEAKGRRRNAFVLWHKKRKRLCFSVGRPCFARNAVWSKRPVVPSARRFKPLGGYHTINVILPSRPHRTSVCFEGEGEGLWYSGAASWCRLLADDKALERLWWWVTLFIPLRKLSGPAFQVGGSAYNITEKA